MAREGKDDEVDDPIEFENIPGSDDYIEFLGEEYDEFGDNPGNDDYVQQFGEVDDIGEIVDCHNIGRDDGDGFDSHDDSYMEHSDSGSSDSEESLVDDYEIHEDPEDTSSDEGERNFNLPLEVWDSQRERDGCGKMVFFTLGMTFLDRGELRKAIDNYAIEKGVNVKIVKSEKKMVIATCEDSCPFRLYASSERGGTGYMVKSLNHEHMCARVYKNQRASARWLAEYFKDKVQANPQYSVTKMKKDVERDLKVSVSRYKCKRAKRMIMEVMDGGFADEYNKLEAYCNELKVSNPGSDVSVELSGEALDQGRRVFRRMYICFNASKVGWKLGCRPFIGLDGTFLKGKARGILLTAVGLDANDSMFPLAFALTEKETTVNWSWFIQWLRSSLDLDDGGKVTIMSDMQKGLLQAVRDVLPLTEHRLCARHVYANWSKRWRGNEMKKKFFCCAWSTYKEQFNDNLKALEKVNKEATTAVVSYPIKGWVRAFFSSRCLSMVVDNNISESFNAWINEYRYFPVIKMIDGIRIKLMEKWAASERIVTNWKGNFSPKCTEFFDTNRYLSTKCSIFFNGDDGYEITEGNDRHTVDLSRKLCTCQAWVLTGIPCQHAICAMFHAKVEPTTQISQYYHRDTYLASYRTKFQPIRGQVFWETHKFGPLLPPPICKLPGRPPKRRKRTEEQGRRLNRCTTLSHAMSSQVDDNNTSGSAPGFERMSKKGTVMKCSVCKTAGHNRSTCKEAPRSSNPRLRKKKPHLQSSQQEASSASQSTAVASTQQSLTPRESGSQSTGRKRCYRPVRPRPCGFGIMVDEDSGRSVYNPGLRTEKVIEEGTPAEFMDNPNPTKKFPIPNEAEIRKSSAATPTANDGSRKIGFTSSYTDSDLPVNPPGLRWMGQPSISSSQLRMQMQQSMARRTSQQQQQGEMSMLRRLDKYTN